MKITAKALSKELWEKVSVLVLGLLMIGVQACKHDIPEPLGGEEPIEEPGGNCDPNTVYFERDVLPILISNCALSGCHDANSRQDGVQLTDYESVIRTADINPGKPDDSELYEVLVEDDVDDRMPLAPRSPLPASQIEVIRKWISQGAKNLTCTDNTTCSTENITFSATIQPILQKNCLGCHSGATPSGNVNLSTYAGVQKVATNGKLVGVVSHAAGFIPMPQGGAKLSDCDITKIKEWVNAGAPNN